MVSEMKDVPEWANAAIIAQLLGVSTRRIQKLTQDGFLIAERLPDCNSFKYRVCETIQAYIAMSKSSSFSSEQLTDAKRFADLLSKVPEEKRAVVVMMAQAFISGMEAQEQLAAEKVS